MWSLACFWHNSSLDLALVLFFLPLAASRQNDNSLLLQPISFQLLFPTKEKLHVLIPAETSQQD